MNNEGSRERIATAIANPDSKSRAIEIPLAPPALRGGETSCSAPRKFLDLILAVNGFVAYSHRSFRIEFDIHQLARPSLIYDSGVGKILPGLHSPVGLKISLTDAITLRSSGLKMSGM